MLSLEVEDMMIVTSCVVPLWKFETLQYKVSRELRETSTIAGLFLSTYSGKPIVTSRVSEIVTYRESDY